MVFILFSLLILMMQLGRCLTGTRSKICQCSSLYEPNKLPDMTKLLQKLIDMPASHDPTLLKNSTVNSRINSRLWISKSACGYYDMKHGLRDRKVTRMPGDGPAPTSSTRSTPTTLMCSENLTEQSFMDMLPCTDSNSFIIGLINIYSVQFLILILT